MKSAEGLVGSLAVRETNEFPQAVEQYRTSAGYMVGQNGASSVDLCGNRVCWYRDLRILVDLG